MVIALHYGKPLLSNHSKKEAKFVNYRILVTHSALHVSSEKSAIFYAYLVLFAIFLVKCARQCQNSKWLMLSFTWQYQNSQAYERNHYSRTFLVIALVKQKISNRLKCWSSLFADILLHYGARSSGSSHTEMFWSLNVTTGLALQCR